MPVHQPLLPLSLPVPMPQTVRQRCLELLMQMLTTVITCESERIKHER